MEIDKALEAVLREPDDCQCAFCIGAKALAREVKRLRELVYIGDHEFPELTWKARCLEDHHEIECLRDILRSCASRADSVEEHNRIIQELNDARTAKEKLP